MARSIQLIPFDPEWPGLAAKWAARLDVLGAALVTVHHIGSTSIPGLAAKPIIDLLPVVTSLTELDRHQRAMEELGFWWRGEFGLPGRRYCSLDDAEGVRRVQLHFFAAGSPEIDRHVAFRDYLRAYPETAQAYEAEKRRARDLHPTDIGAYTDEKDAWIRVTKRQALTWWASRSPV